MNQEPVSQTAEEVARDKRITADRTIEVGDDDKKTMTRHRMGYRGFLRFYNRSSTLDLVIKSRPYPVKPFQLGGCGDGVDTFTVPSSRIVTVTIHPDFKSDVLIYSARLGKLDPEDPIIILDRD